MFMPLYCEMGPAYELKGAWDAQGPVPARGAVGLKLANTFIGLLALGGANCGRPIRPLIVCCDCPVVSAAALTHCSMQEKFQRSTYGSSFAI